MSDRWGEEQIHTQQQPQHSTRSLLTGQCPNLRGTTSPQSALFTALSAGTPCANVRIFCHACCIHSPHGSTRIHLCLRTRASCAAEVACNACMLPDSHGFLRTRRLFCVRVVCLARHSLSVALWQTFFMSCPFSSFGCYRRDSCSRGLLCFYIFLFLFV